VDLGLHNKVAIVSGGSQGLGSFVVEALAAEGARVVFTYHHSKDEAERLVAELTERGGTATALQANAMSMEDAERVVETAIGLYGQADILVNIVGGSGKQEGPIWTMTSEEWHNVLEHNLTSCFHYTRAICGHFMERQNGTIVNMGSINGLRGREGQPAYSTAKAGLVGFTKTVAKELGLYNVNVNMVVCGYIKPMKKPDQVKELAKRYMLNERAMKHLTEPDEIANLITFLCSRQAKYMTGSIIKMDSGEYI